MSCTSLCFHAVVPQVLSAPSEQTLQAWAGVGVVECQVSNGTQVIEWWLEGRQVAALNLTAQGGGGRGGENSNATKTEHGSSTPQGTHLYIHCVCSGTGIASSPGR